MPIIDKQDRNNWYNGIRAKDAAGGPLRPFTPSQIKGNEFRWGTETVARIPQIPGRISRKNVKSEDGRRVTRYVELILERNYDKEKGQTRNKRATIGIDISHIAEGLMIINDNYHKYFDRDGKLIYHSETIGTPQDNVPKEKPKPKPLPEQEQEAVRPQQPNRAKGTEAGTETVTANHDPEGNAMDKPEDRETQEELNKRKHEEEHLRFLDGMLSAYFNSVTDMAKKRPDKTMTRYQIRRINEILKEIREYFKGTDLAGYLELAEEPSQDNQDEPSITYADMEILLHAYNRAMSTYWFGTVWYK